MPIGIMTPEIMFFEAIEASERTRPPVNTLPVR